MEPFSLVFAADRIDPQGHSASGSSASSGSSPLGLWSRVSGPSSGKSRLARRILLQPRSGRSRDRRFPSVRPGRASRVDRSRYIAIDRVAAPSRWSAGGDAHHFSRPRSSSARVGAGQPQRADCGTFRARFAGVDARGPRQYPSSRRRRPSRSRRPERRVHDRLVHCRPARGLALGSA